MDSPCSISVVIPTLNEAPRIASAIARIKTADISEIIVVDGGSSDDTAALAESQGVAVLRSNANRGAQQNLGAERAGGSILLFLHADTSLPADFACRIRSTLAGPGVSAGAFSLRLDGESWGLRLVERVVALRCKFFQLPYGDQAIFVKKAVFEKAGGFPDAPVMEDFDLVRRLKKLGSVVIADAAVLTSARRWREIGVWRMTWINQLCICGYYLGVSPERLARRREPAKKAAPPRFLKTSCK